MLVLKSSVVGFPYAINTFKFLTSFSTTICHFVILLNKYDVSSCFHRVPQKSSFTITLLTFLSEVDKLKMSA
ncbi:unnamed protein product [Trifolium pratense]|uniref:Uncharacterized protein n=1 Tax=Trifolium pratense TaxID=57577 RepID=A0ACB0IS35_TRIPR|nr:unnamed protein product [Trifolium pratense]